jgi:hypothetical protein
MLKNKKLITGLCILFLLVAGTVSAVRTAGTVAEITSVSRLVGNSPYDLINQLDTKQINMNHATHLSNRLDVFEGVTDSRTIIDAFPDNYNVQGDGSVHDPNLGEATYFPWNGYGTISEEINKFKANELFVLESYIDLDDFGVYSKKLSKSDKIYPKDVGSWRNKFSETNPLLLFNTEGVGLALPNQPNYVNELTRYSTIIAPKDVRSAEFGTALLCNLNDNQRIGDVYRRTRTKYYTSTDPSDQNMPGLVLKSYALYGNPLTRVEVPDKYEESIKDTSWFGWFNPCTDYYVPPEEYIYAGYSIQSTDNLKIAHQLSFSHDIVSVPNSTYQIINSSDLIYDSDNPNLIGLYTIRTHRLPKGSFIKNINYSFTNPVDLIIPDYPSMMDGKYVDKNCFDSIQEEEVTREVYETNNYDEVVVYINPLKINNCTAGSLTLFTNVQYEMEYMPFSSFYFDNLQYDKLFAPDKQINLTFDLQYVSNEALSGDIVLLKDNDILYQRKINERLNNYSLQFHTFKEEGISNYELQYLENGTVKTSSSFDIETRIIDASIAVGEFDGNSADISVELFNYFEHDLPVSIKLELTDGFVEVYNQKKTLIPGKNTYNINVNNLEKQAISYGFKVYIEYENSRKILSDIIVTNNAPVIDIDDVYVRVGDLIEVNPDVYDADGDALTYNMLPEEYSRIALESDIGEHSVTITASDTFSTTTKVISLVVLPENYEPELYGQDDITVKEGEPVSIILYGEDIEGDSLTYSIDNPNFNQIDYNWFEWWTQEGDSGTYTISYSVSDGKDTVTKQFELNIEVDLCKEVVCDNHCDGYTYYSEGTCASGTCEYSNVEEASVNCFNSDIYTIEDKFSDKTKQKDLDMSVNQTVYITIPKNAQIISAKYDLTGR